MRPRGARGMLAVLAMLTLLAHPASCFCPGPFPQRATRNSPGICQSAARWPGGLRPGGFLREEW